ncbi:hypothetical protein ACFVFS_03345 [Kitasatospora sp. NPDC057692]|uniref:hypothetical protein n=1 Tax=Kitasatospora sp. NPDC057692 TaxID=3346215 RepID=UPI0036A5C64F
MWTPKWLKKRRSGKQAQKQGRDATREIGLDRIVVRFPQLNSRKQWYLFGIFVFTDAVIVLLLFIWWSAINQNTTSAWPTIVIGLATGLIAAALFGLGDAIIARRAHDQYTEELGDATLTVLNEQVRSVRETLYASIQDMENKFERMRSDLEELKLESNPTVEAQEIGLVKILPQSSGSTYHDVLNRLIRGTPELILILNFDPKWIIEHASAFRSRLADPAKTTIVCIPDLRDSSVLRILNAKHDIPAEELNRRQISIFTRLENLRPAKESNRPFTMLGHIHLHTCQVALGTTQAIVEPYFTVPSDDRSAPAFWYRGSTATKYVRRLHGDALDLIGASQNMSQWFERQLPTPSKTS